MKIDHELHIIECSVDEMKNIEWFLDGGPSLSQLTNIVDRYIKRVFIYWSVDGTVYAHVLHHNNDRQSVYKVRIVDCQELDTKLGGVKMVEVHKDDTGTWRVVLRYDEGVTELDADRYYTRVNEECPYQYVMSLGSGVNHQSRAIIWKRGSHDEACAVMIKATKALDRF